MSTKQAYNPDFITPIKPKHNWRILSDEDLNLLKEATFRILNEVGVHFPLESALTLFADHGAEVNFESQVVRMSQDLVEKALGTAPRYYNLGGRTPEFDFHLQENHTFYANDGCHPFIIDPETREKRHSTKSDLAKISRMIDYLKPFSFILPMMSASDYGETAPLHEVHACLANCRKHVQTESVMGELSARYAVEMALAIRGDRERLRQRPLLSSLICCIDPLGQDTHGLEAAYVFAEAGLPVGFMAMNTLMSTGPATPAGALAVGNAEVLSAIVMLQLAFPGTPVYHAMPMAVMNPFDAGYLFHAPQADAYFGAAIELAHAHGLPTLGSANGTDASAPGWQSGKEGHAGFVSALVGSEMVVGMGGMASATVTYPEYLVMDSDQFYDDLAVTAGFEVSSETLALDMIREVGPRGTYLMETHTLDHMREIPLSELIMETQKKGRMEPEGVIETAREKARWIMDNHEPDPLDDATAQELERILARADREIREHN